MITATMSAAITIRMVRLLEPCSFTRSFIDRLRRVSLLRNGQSASMWS
jgi:hypothetical protein